MEEKRKYTKLQNTEYKNKLVQVKLTASDYDSVINHATANGYTSVSAFIRDLIKQEIAKSN